MIALDLFAGTGWGVACQRLGIEEYGVEIMPEARATRAANGMRTLYADVWDGLTADAGTLDALIAERPEHQATEAARLIGEGWSFGEVYDLLIASPPCQTFSMAGGGAGRRALDDVLEAIATRAYMDPAALREFGEKHDPRTALVLTPLAHVARDTPTYVVFEQVPPVLPVWKACADEMRRWGYSVWTGIVNAEEHGVPQTRRRAILIARADGKEAKAPTPTHNRYNPRAEDGGRHADPALLPWVSMAEALGWGMTERPMVTAGNAVGRAEGVGGSGAKAAIEREKDRGAWQSADDRPAPTVTSGGTATGGAEVFGRWGRDIVTKMRSNYGTNGDAEQRGEREIDEPSPTVTSKIDRNKWIDERGNERPLLSGGAEGSDVWEGRPATTIATDGIVAGPGWSAPVKGGISRQNRPGTERVTVAEAAALQSYPDGFEWNVVVPDGKGGTKPITKTKQFLQIGNAVPPLMAEAIIREVLS